MGFRDLLVHVNVSTHCPSRLDIAAHLAQAFGAHLTAAFTNESKDVAFFMIEEVRPQVEPTMRGWWMKMRDDAKAAFEKCRQGGGIDADWLEIDADITARLAHLARYADLTIVGQSDPDEILPRPEYDIPERVVLASGRPVLVVPYAGTFPTVGSRILIAWNGSPQSARAVNDALPLLTRAQEVTILTINPDKIRVSDKDAPASRLATHLSRHQVKARVRELTVADIAVDDMILSQAADESADLIVMGAYGHPRAGEIVFGGATRALFRQMTVPTLMSH